MARIIHSPPADIKAMMNHVWFLEDQEVAFSSAPFSPEEISVSDRVSSWMRENNYKSAQIENDDVYIEDPQIPSCLLNQALDFLQKAIGNTVAHYMLAKDGLETWARVTNYYAGYFSVHSLLCLQGRTITRLRLDKTAQVQLIPIDLRNHVFGVTESGVKGYPQHAIPWKKFYEVYDNYTVSHSAYESVTKKTNKTDPLDESTERNSLNYSPFVGFAEIRESSRRQEFLSFFKDYVCALEQKNTLGEFLINLRGLATDPECRYFARTLLKIALIGDIFLSLRNENSALRDEWVSATLRWRQFLNCLFSDTENCYLLKFIPLIGTEIP